MATIGRPKAAVVVTEDERTELVRLTKRAHVNRLLAFRARLVLACADGVPDTTVARRQRTTKTTVGKWRRRFIASRLDGLFDEPRVGGPRTISDEDVEAVIVTTLETTPKGATHWGTRTMAAKAGISHTMVGRIWRTFGLQPHITHSFTISPDPQLVDKIRDVVGLYMNPPTNAVVFSFDEKPQIQALQRAQPILPMDLGQAERRTHNYIGHGTLDLFGAQRRDWRGPHAVQTAASRPGLRGVPPRHRRERRARPRGASGAGQSLRAQGAGRASLVAPASAGPLTLHTDVRVVG